MDIKFLVLDVDGTLTDSNVYIGADNEVFKAFNIKDGCGIKELLPKYGITPIIITARKSQALAYRCSELGISECHQGCREKLYQLKKILRSKSYNYSFRNVAYMGDDLLDMEPMHAVIEAGGFGICPNNAIDKVKDIADYICVHNAGDGAVREFIDWIVEKTEGTKTCKIKEYSQEAFNFTNKIYDEHIADGSYKLNDGVIANVMTYTTKPALLTSYESHKKYIDVQYMIYGEELFFIEDTSLMDKWLSIEYNESKDITFFDYNLGTCNIFKAGDVMILKPQNAHRGAIAVDKPRKIRKIVFKIPFTDSRHV